MRIVLGLIALATSVALAAGQDSTVLGVSAKPTVVRAGSPVTAIASGKGLCGAVHIDWGDGTAITYPTSTLPVSQSHNYQYGGSYTIRAQGMGNCSGQATTTVRVEGPAPPNAPAPPPAPPAPTTPKGPSIASIDVSTPGDAAASMRAIRVAGTGTCAYKLDFGDGNSEGRNAALPDVVRHNYPAPGRYTVIATASAPCAGSARSTLVVGDIDPDARRDGGRVSAIDVARDARAGTAVVIDIQGSGYCRITVDFDDERQREITASLPTRVTHRFDNPGDYQIVAWAHAPCRGGGSAELRVK